ncbi:hypothetical protein SMICM304S_08531 [Streptomyces microflavus]
MPCLPSTSTRRVRLPSVARASARAAATVVLPVPPLPLTTWNLLTYSSLTSPAPGYARDLGCQALQSGP